MSVRLQVEPDLAAITQAAGRLVAAAAVEAVARHGAFWLALCGGKTPQGLYRALAGPLAAGLPWPRVTLCLGDDRRVPEAHPESNAGMIRRLLVAPLAPAPRFVAPDGAEADGDLAAAAYEAALREAFGGGPLDLSLQGLGDDGHTASLFPGSPAFAEGEAWLRAVPAPTTVPPPLPRITMTPGYLVRSRQILLLVAGASKAEPLRRLLAPEGDERACPSRLIHRCQGEVVVLADRAAAP